MSLRHSMGTCDYLILVVLGTTSHSGQSEQLRGTTSSQSRSRGPGVEGDTPRREGRTHSSSRRLVPRVCTLSLRSDARLDGVPFVAHKNSLDCNIKVL